MKTSYSRQRPWRKIAAPSLALLLLILSGAATAGENSVQSKFITLGTNSGPIPNPKRAEPSNALVYGEHVIVIDAGDGVAWQLAKAGIHLGQVNTVLLSHLHFDHTGGLFALLSQRLQINYPSPLTIYGPEGTQQTVNALLAAMKPMRDDLDSTMTRFLSTPEELFKVVELKYGANINIGPIKITTGKNSHYILIEESNKDEKTNSKVRTLAFRFDLPDRSIVYTGDTGPSEDVIKLAKGADLLVTEMMDPEESLARMQLIAAQANFSFIQRSMMTLAGGVLKGHFEKQHLSPENAGRMAQQAGVKTLVITHNAVADQNIEKAKQLIKARYKGPLFIAKDLQEF